MNFTDFAQTLNDSEIGTALRESVYAFPIVEGIHLIGLAFSIGLLFFLDLRLLGLFLPQVPVALVMRPLRPWLLGGFTVTIVTGVLLFTAAATKIAALSVFLYKLGFIALAGINALWFELRWGRSALDWGSRSILPIGVKVAGAASLVLWSLVVITGRLIPYMSYE
jgi:hypothetical protein